MSKEVRRVRKGSVTLIMSGQDKRQLHKEQILMQKTGGSATTTTLDRKIRGTDITKAVLNSYRY